MRRVWADGREIDLTHAHHARASRAARRRPPIRSSSRRRAPQNAPAYRGLAYVVFERLPLADFGNRVPQFSFEVIRPVDGLNRMIRAVCLIPGASEFGYDDDTGRAGARPRHDATREPPSTGSARATSTASLDALQALCPNLKRVSLVVSWFGDDLRAGSCHDRAAGRRDDEEYRRRHLVRGGLDAREARRRCRSPTASPAYGGTPSDETVKRLIKDLKERGLEVVLYPFVMMDVPAGNSLPDPYGGTGQPPYPWRGRITCHPAPGKAGTPDGTAAAATQVERVVHAGGRASPHDRCIMRTLRRRPAASTASSSAASSSA